MKWLITFVAFLLLSACTPSPIAIVTPTIVTAVPQKPASPTAPASTKQPGIMPSPRKTARPFVSPSPSPLSPQHLLKGPLVAFNQLSYSLWLYDLGTQSGRRLIFQDGYPKSVQWSSDGCQLYITLVDDAASLATLVQTDLRGNVLRTILQMSTYDSDNKDVYRSAWSLSPSGKWVAFIGYSGEQYYSGSEYQDVIVVNVGRPSKPVTLTLHSGGLGYAWSPTETRIAYSDYDDSGVRQLYVMDLNHNVRSQLTRFTEHSASNSNNSAQPGNYIGKPVWSLDGSSIAVHEFVVDAQKVVTGSIRIISMNGGGQIRVAPVNLPDTRWLAWSDDGRTIAFFSPANHEGNEKDTIFWINAENGVLRGELNSSKVPEGWFTSVFSFHDVRLIGITNYLPTTNSYSYDYQTKNLKEIAMPDILENPDYVEAIAAPAGFLGEEACNRK